MDLFEHRERLILLFDIRHLYSPAIQIEMYRMKVLALEYIIL